MMASAILSESYDLIRHQNKLESGQLKIKTLAGDASLRQYFRVYEGENSYVLMLTEAFNEKENNFLLVRNYLEKAGVPVPKLLAVDGTHGALLLEDLTDRTMLHVLGEMRNSDDELKCFHDALDLLVKFHHKGSQATKEDKKLIPGFGQAFDVEKLMWEVDFTIEHLFTNYLKRELTAKELGILRGTFTDICERLAKEPRVFTHRDYHSRNIMIPASGAYTSIDFQDARMGLRQYDLASILRDSYYQLSNDRIYDLVDYYIAGVKKAEGIDLPRDHFVTLFDLMSIQRNFKAIGSFTMFYAKRNNASYIRFVGNTFENIRRNLLKFPEYRELLTLLYNYYYF
jgi:N-acetylmuramate 1-kinase